MKIKLDYMAFLPERAHATDAGYDLRTPVDFVLFAHDFAVIDTGVHIQLPPGKCAVLTAKSGLYTKHRITSSGLVDEGYTGSICVGLMNHSDETLQFRRGDKISQFYITDYYAEPLEIVDELDESERGDHGFGSTGR